MVWLVLAPVVLGIAVYFLPKIAARCLAVAAQIPFAYLAIEAWMRAHRDGPFIEILGGDDASLYITLRGDHTSLALVTLTVLLVTASLVYAMRAKYADNRFLLLLLVLQGLASGLFIVDDVFTLFVLFELVGLVTVLGIMYRRARRNTYDGLYYLIIQLVAMAFFLFGVAYLYRSFGVLSVSQIDALVAAGAVDPRALVLPFAFMFSGIALKAGLFPLFSYVPRSYGNPGAPSVMLLLMSGVLVKAALFWVYRLVGIFSPVLDLPVFLGVVGVLTGLVGAAKALSQDDVRLVLAYSTVSQSGLVVLGLAAATPTAVAGAQLHLINHALVKSVLFLTAAMVIRRYGSGSLAEIKGVGRRMPLVAVLTSLALLGLVGAPFTGGAVSKDMMLLGASGWIEAAMWLINIGTIAVATRLALVLFGEPKTDSIGAAWRPVPDQAAVAIVLTAFSAGVALFATQTVDLVVGYELAIQFWPGAVKIATFALLLAGVLVVRRLGKSLRPGLREATSGALSLPRAALALTIFFAATALYATLMTSGAAP